MCYSDHKKVKGLRNILKGILEYNIKTLKVYKKKTTTLKT